MEGDSTQIDMLVGDIYGKFLLNSCMRQQDIGICRLEINASRYSVLKISIIIKYSVSLQRAIVGLNVQWTSIEQSSIFCAKGSHSASLFCTYIIPKEMDLPL